MKVICIIGVGHSGSTILDRVLGSYPGAVPIGEFRRVWTPHAPNCGCGERFPTCEFWESVGARALGGWKGIDITAKRQGEDVIYRWYAAPFLRMKMRPPFLRAALAQFEADRRALLEAVANTAAASVLVDSSKSPSYGLALAAVGIEVTVVHLTRDPRGVVYSSVRRTERFTGSRPSLRAQLRIARRFSFRWLDRSLRAEFCWFGSQRRVRVRYEEFAAEPERLAQAILRRVDHVVEPATERTIFDLSGHHIFAGNPVRHQKGSTVVRPDLAWQRDLGRPARWLTLAMTWPLMAAYGYFGRRRG